MREIIVRESQKGALYEDGVFVKVLDPGRYEFRQRLWSRKQHDVTLVDMRNRSITIKGQEILTADKVALRISILVNFRVLDIKAALHNVENYMDRIYEDVQLSVRRLLAARSLEEILKDRNEISDACREDVREAAGYYGVEITRADVKDLVFPGNLREIMNQVLETERRSEAMLIDAQKKAEAIMIKTKGEREALESRIETETALAKQLAQNPALLRLKELETLQKIAEKPGNSFFIGLGDGFTEILAAMKNI